MRWLRRHWLLLLGLAPLLPPTIKGILSLVGLAGSVDFVIARSRDPAWVGDLIRWLIDPPGPAILPLIVIGFVLIYWDRRRRAPAPELTGDGALPRSFKEAMDKGLLQNPESVKASPLYAKLKYKFDPKDGVLSPTNRVSQGREELQALYHRCMKDDFESYLVAGHLAGWLRDNARSCYGSSTNFHETLDFIDRIMDHLHDHYRSPISRIAPRHPEDSPLGISIPNADEMLIDKPINLEIGGKFAHKYWEWHFFLDVFNQSDDPAFNVQLNLHSIYGIVSPDLPGFLYAKGGGRIVRRLDPGARVTFHLFRYETRHDSRYREMFEFFVGDVPGVASPPADLVAANLKVIPRNYKLEVVATCTDCPPKSLPLYISFDQSNVTLDDRQR